MKTAVGIAVWLSAFELLAADALPRAGESAHAPRAADQPANLWEILFEDDTTAEEYARELDFFKIEIGALSPSGKIEYISNVTSPKPDKRVGSTATDYRWRIAWKNGTLQAADRKLLTKAGISSRGKQLFHFFPIAVQSRMAELERDYAHRPTSEIARTRFQIRPQSKGDGYELVVVEQSGSGPADSAYKPPAR